MIMGMMMMIMSYALDSPSCGQDSLEVIVNTVLNLLVPKKEGRLDEEPLAFHKFSA